MTFGFEIALSARTWISAPSFAGFPRCAFILTKKVAVPAAILFRSISMAAARISASGAPLPFHLHQSTYWLPSTMTVCHTNTATAPLSACHEAPVKTLPIHADLSWSPLPHVPLLLFFLCSSQVLISCSHFTLFVWTVTCRYLALSSHTGLERKILWIFVCLFVCP